MCVFAYMYICVCIAIVHIPTVLIFAICYIQSFMVACKTAKVCQVTWLSHGPMESLATFMWFVLTTNRREVHLTWESLNSIGPSDSSVNCQLLQFCKQS